MTQIVAYTAHIKLLTWKVSMSRSVGRLVLSTLRPAAWALSNVACRTESVLHSIPCTSKDG